MLEENRTLYSYVITRDYGFAPNPFGEYCTLATCKPKIRKTALKNDWIVGTGSSSKKSKMGDRLIYAMKVDEVLSFTDYWKDPRFHYKKPTMNGSKKQKYGDNIYRFDEVKQEYSQVNSHHSLADGSTNTINLIRDTGGKNVLVSTEFWYFGKNAPIIPHTMVSDLVKKGRSYKRIKNQIIINHFIEWLTSTYKQGYNGNPILFNKSFERYNGN